MASARQRLGDYATALDNLQIKSEGNETTIRLELKQVDISTLMQVLQPKTTETSK